jgi:hypothetical protein
MEEKSRLISLLKIRDGYLFDFILHVYQFPNLSGCTGRTSQSLKWLDIIHPGYLLPFLLVRHQYRSGNFLRITPYRTMVHPYCFSHKQTRVVVVKAWE